MSEVEETIERIKVQNHGVEGYVICNKQGQVQTSRYNHSRISKLHLRSFQALTIEARCCFYADMPLTAYFYNDEDYLLYKLY